MKRIFLTSGLVLCMACPAFATGEFTTTEIDGGTAAQGGGITIENGCVTANLDTFTGPAQLRAKWTHDYRPITLNTNTTGNGWNGQSNVSQSTIYAIPGDNAHLYTMNGNTDLVVYNSYAIGSGANATPLGKTTTMTWNYNLPTINGGQGGYTAYTTGDLGGTHEASTTSANRVFNGFYAAQTGGSPLIDSTGTITELGYTTASGYTASDTAVEWYAQYQCATPTVQAPTLRGYEFAGWKASAAANAGEGTLCIEDANTVYASWTAHTGTITYSCGTQPGTETQSGTLDPVIQDVTYDQEVTLAANSCVYNGWHFTGWKCSYNLENGVQGSGTDTTYSFDGTAANRPTVLYRVASSTSPATNVEITCTAQWARNEVALHWDANQATTYTANGGASCDYDGNITLPASPERTGYSFNGWEVVTVSGSSYTDSPTVPAQQSGGN